MVGHVLQSFDGGKIVVYELRSGSNGVSLAAQNHYEIPMQITIKCTVNNALSHSGSLTATKVSCSTSVCIIIIIIIIIITRRRSCRQGRWRCCTI